MQAMIYQVEPLISQSQASARCSIAQHKAAAIPLKLQVDEIAFTSPGADYRSSVAGLQSQIHLGKLLIHPRLLDLDHHILDFKNILLDTTTASILLANENTSEAAGCSGRFSNGKCSDWQFRVDDLSLGKDQIRFDDDSRLPQKEGMDYSHIDARDLSIGLKDFAYNADSITGIIYKGQFNEKSGFVLNELSTHFLYTNSNAYLHDLVVVTPGSRIRRSLSVRYGDISTISRRLGDLQMDLDLPDSKIQVKDILYFVPSLSKQPVFSNPAETWTINGKASGPLNQLKIPLFTSLPACREPAWCREWAGEWTAFQQRN